MVHNTIHWDWSAKHSDVKNVQLNRRTHNYLNHPHFINITLLYLREKRKNLPYNLVRLKRETGKQERGKQEI